MRDKPEGMDETGLVSALADGWGVEVRSAKYLPVGAGSYHWAVADDGGRARFVTVDDLGAEDGPREAAFNVLGRAFDTALAIRRDAGLGFVVAPLPTRTGSTVWRLGSRYAVSVFPMVEGEAGRFAGRTAPPRTSPRRGPTSTATWNDARALVGTPGAECTKVRGNPACRAAMTWTAGGGARPCRIRRRPRKPQLRRP